MVLWSQMQKNLLTSTLEEVSVKNKKRNHQKVLQEKPLRIVLDNPLTFKPHA